MAYAIREWEVIRDWTRTYVLCFAFFAQTIESESEEGRVISEEDPIIIGSYH